MNHKHIEKIAESMGWTRGRCNVGHNHEQVDGWWRPGGTFTVGDKSLPQFGVHPEASMLLIDHMDKLGWSFKCVSRGRTWVATFFRPATPYTHPDDLHIKIETGNRLERHLGDGETFPEAVAAAFVKVNGIKG